MKKFILSCLFAVGFLPIDVNAFVIKDQLYPYNATFQFGQTLQTTMYMFDPVALPLIENFDGSTHAFTLSNGSQTNQWAVGTATSASPGKSLYISNNGGVGNAYGGSTSVVHAFSEVSIPDTAVDLALSFDFKCYGESTYDYMRVWLVPNTYTPTVGTQITAAASGGILVSVGPNIANTNGNLNGTSYSLGESFQSQFQNLTFIFPAGTFAGQNAKLVFEWSNDISVQNNPPAAVDNIQFSVLSCPQPSNIVIDEVGVDQALISWTPGDAETQWEVIILPASASAPEPTDTGVIVDEPSYTATDLLESTQYKAYVRAICDEDDTSFWTASEAFYTTQIPAELPYSENFDGNNPPLTFINGSSTNQWILGTATSLSPNHSVYISNNGTANTYSNTNTNVFFYRDLAIPAGAVDIAVSFDSKGLGNSADFTRVWLAPTTFNPVAGTAITEGGGISLVATNIYNQEQWTHGQYAVNAQAFAGGTARLIFEYVCNNTTLNQPPTAIDNLFVELITCPQPIDITVTKNAQGQMVISWTPTGNETQWELVIQEQNEGLPDGTETMITVTNNPVYAFNATQGMMYEVYVRAYCSEDEQSLWSGPVDFSDFNPPACADLSIEPLDLNVNENGEYVVCEGEEVTIPLNATFDAESFKSTTSYSVEQIDYAPPFPFIGGIEMDVTIDDTWSPIFNLPFDICFYGNTFNTAQVGSNGMVAFGTDHCTTAGCAPWSMGAGLSFPSTTYDNRLRNVIMGVYQDIYPGPTTSPNGSINYQVLGTYPCRALVVNFKDINNFSCLASTGPQTSQIVIYEITNIVEVYIERRVPCTTFNGGRGAVGLINEDGSQATIPPGRNVGSWTAEEEAWRFTPSGETTVDFAWYANGVLIGTDPQMDYTINETTHFEAVITYPGCGDDDLELRKSFTVRISEQIILPNDIDDVIVCVYDGEDPKVDLNALKGDILSKVEHPSEFDVDFYLTQADADADTNKIDNPSTFVPPSFPQVIHVRVTSLETGCYELTSFRIIEGEIPQLDQPEDLIICTSYQLPELPDPKFTYHEIVYKDMTSGFPIETKQDVPAGTILPIGDYDITIRLESKDGCEDYIEYSVTVVACDLPKGISPNNDGLNDRLDLTNYRALSLKIYNRYGKEVYSHGLGYTDQWEGQDNSGNKLPDGTYFIDLITPFERFTQWIQLSRESN